MNQHFKGLGVAMITPFKEDSSVDYEGIEKIVSHLINQGVNYLVPLGSTGESANINAEEERKILDLVIKINAGRVPIVAGSFGLNNTIELVKKIKNFNFEGIDAILSSSPAYIKPSQEGIYQHFMKVQEASPVPILLYNVPGRTRSNMEWDTTVRLAKASNKFIGIKEAAGDLIQITRIVKNKPDGFLVISGDDETALPLIAVGGDGLISVMGNALPNLYSKMISAAMNNDYVQAREINNKTYDLHKWLYIEGNPVGIKSAMAQLGFCSNMTRLPLVPMSAENKSTLEFELTQILS